ncbi:MAG: hypothetical protein GY835_19600, partial [bacterium]|nr:hypothetical protein [bacterium]
MLGQLRGASPAGSARSSVQAGDTAVDVTRRARRTESLSPGIEGDQQDRHESRDVTKKKTPASTTADKGDVTRDGWGEPTAAAPVKKMGRGRFDEHRQPEADRAGPSHGGFRPLQKRPAPPSQSPMKVSPKIQRQRAIMYM